MEQTVVALFDDVNSAEQALHELLKNGFHRNDISFMRTRQGWDATLGAASDKDMTHTDGTAAGAGIGAVLGGVAGLVVGLGALTIPGIGPILAAGPLAVTLAGAGVGAATGSIVGALTDSGIPEHEVGFYAEGLRRGATLIAVRTDESQASRATEIMSNHSPAKVDESGGEQRVSGSTGLEPSTREHQASASGSQAYDPGYDRTAAEMSRTFEMYDPDFRADWEQTYRSGGYGYQRYRPAYQYGYRLATEKRYGNRSWSEVEPEARQQWEAEHPNDRWIEFRDAVREAWQTVRNDMRGSAS